MRENSGSRGMGMVGMGTGGMVSDTSPSFPLDRHPELVSGLRVAQTIVGALLLGVVIFLLVLFFLRGKDGGVPSGAADGTTDGISMSLVLGVLAIVQIPVFFLLRTALLGAARQRILAGAPPPPTTTSPATPFAAAGDAGRLFQAWLTTTILLAAGMEAGALLCLVAYFLEGSSVLLVMAAAFGLLLAFQMPSRRTVDHWLEKELAWLETERAR